MEINFILDERNRIQENYLCMISGVTTLGTTFAASGELSKTKKKTGYDETSYVLKANKYGKEEVYAHVYYNNILRLEELVEISTFYVDTVVTIRCIEYEKCCLSSCGFYLMKKIKEDLKVYNPTNLFHSFHITREQYAHMLLSPLGCLFYDIHFRTKNHLTHFKIESIPYDLEAVCLSSYNMIKDKLITSDHISMKATDIKTRVQDLINIMESILSSEEKKGR